jgi:hypothetical protein
MNYVIGHNGRRRCIGPCCRTIQMNSTEQKAQRIQEIELQNRLVRAVKFMIALAEEGRAG